MVVLVVKMRNLVARKPCTSDHGGSDGDDDDVSAEQKPLRWRCL